MRIVVTHRDLDERCNGFEVRWEAPPLRSLLLFVAVEFSVG